MSYLLRLCKIGWCMSIYNHCSPGALDALSLPLHHWYPNLKLRIFRIRVQVYFNIGGIAVLIPGGRQPFRHDAAFQFLDGLIGARPGENRPGGSGHSIYFQVLAGCEEDTAM